MFIWNQESCTLRRVGVSTLLSNNLGFFSLLDNETLFESLENTSLLETLANTKFPTPFNDEKLTASDSSGTFRTGEIKLYAGSSPPASPWLLCYGTIISRSEYPHRFSIIGTKYGEGDNSTTFKLHDLRGGVPLGVDTQ